MKMSEFQYNLPEEKIAKFPPKERGTTKLLVLDRNTGDITHRNYSNIIEYIKPGDVVVLNETKVEKRRTYFLTPKGRRIEILFLNHTEDRKWYCLIKGARYVKEGDVLEDEEDRDIKVKVGERYEDGFLIEAYCEEPENIFSKVGHTPIPPYMKRSDTPEDYIRYNTIFARLEGSVASPTASLNLTSEMLANMEKKGIKIVKVELEVGWGTFAPVREENIEEHNIHKERISISKESAKIINEAKREGKDIWAFGTTVARTLESVCDTEGIVKEYKGETNLYIYPGYQWKCINHLITNFHMPDSSLILLVSSFAEKELIKKAYAEALENDYKFLSYGDSMLII
ncbi:MAG: tRNA preQ1(34) S-adenosylmethionine ribosyltransferase-isomerase QueA [Candidatus Dojkabacteria bacterium]